MPEPIVYECPVAECAVTEPHRPSHWVHRNLDFHDHGDPSGPAPRCVQADEFLEERGIHWSRHALARCGAAVDPPEPCRITDSDHTCARRKAAPDITERPSE